MKEKRNSKERSFRRWIAGTLGVIFLGAIGSGIWQMLGEPLTAFATKVIILGIDYIFGNYKDSIYKKASLGFHESSSTNLYLIVLLSISLLPIVYAMGRLIGRASIDNEYGAEPRVKVQKGLRVARYLLLLFYLVFGLGLAAHQSYKSPAK